MISTVQRCPSTDMVRAIGQASSDHEAVRMLTFYLSWESKLSLLA